MRKPQRYEFFLPVPQRGVSFVLTKWRHCKWDVKSPQSTRRAHVRTHICGSATSKIGELSSMTCNTWISLTLRSNDIVCDEETSSLPRGILSVRSMSDALGCTSETWKTAAS